MSYLDPKDIDLKIADFYAAYILGSLKHGENRICIWFPGCGKTSSINLVITNKKVLKSNLSELYKRLVFIPFSGLDSENAQSDEVLRQIYLKFGAKDDSQVGQTLTNNIIEGCKKVIDQGKEIVFVGNEIENLPKNEYQKLLSSLLRIVLTNRARIHTIINIKNKDMFDNAVSINNSILTLANKMQYVPVLQNNLLRGLINKFMLTFDKVISKKEVERIEKYTGGISILTKELIRNYPEEGQVNLKFRECLRHMSEKSINNIEELKNYKVEKLSIIKNKKYLASENPKEYFNSIAKSYELNLLEFFNKNKGKLIDREKIANVIWDSAIEGEYSDWAIDQIVSRFRKKLIKAEIDPKRLRTVKGKGYQWN